MKQLFFNILGVIVLMTCAGTIPATASEDGAQEGYKTYELSEFFVSIPAEFVKQEGWSSETNMRLNSEAYNLRDDGEEYSSSATIDVYYVEGDIPNINEYAANWQIGVRLTDGATDEPIIEGNTVLLHSYYDVDDGTVHNWRFTLINGDGRVAGGMVSYHSSEAKYYEGILRPLIQSIQFK